MTLVSAQAPNPDTLELEVKFSDVSRVFSSLKGGSESVSAGQFATFTKSGNTRTITVRVDRSDISAILGLTPLSGSVAANVLLPPKDYPMTAEEYVSYLSWALADYAKNGDVKPIIRNASIEVTVRVAGTVISQTGGTLQGNSVRFSLPVVKLVTAEKPATYSVTFR